jgi:peptidoglycan hydrolase-like protein with peptidoglycan-binding domain
LHLNGDFFVYRQAVNAFLLLSFQSNDYRSPAAANGTVYVFDATLRLISLSRFSKQRRVSVRPDSQARSVNHMDQKDGGYGYPPYEEDPRAAGQGSGTPRGYQDDPAVYGGTPLQQFDPNAPYDPAYVAGQPGYDERGYAAQQGYPDPENPYAPRPIDPNYGYQYPQGNAYGNQQEYYAQQPPVGTYAQQPTDGYAPQPPAEGYAPRQSTGRYSDNPDSAYATRLQMTDYSQRGTTARTQIPAGEEDYDYPQRGTTGRTSIPRESAGYGYTGRSTTSRTRMPEDVEEFTPRSQTSRTRMPESEDDYSTRSGGTRSRYPQNEDRYAREADEDDEAYERPRSSKKKRSKFGKFMHALGLYLAQLPSKTLIIFGGIFAVVLAAVILIAVLTSNSGRPEPLDNGQLGITDTTPTPSLAPTNTPAPTEEVSPTPALPVLTENIVNAGTVSDLLPDIQKRLVELGYMTEPDGGYTTKFGPVTKTAIRLFQLKNFSDPKSWDGIIGNGTYTLLMSEDAKAYYLTHGDGDDRTKVITKLVEDVTKLQNRLIELGYLTGSATGLYGNTTVQAVQTFQEYHGLPMDGKAGQETLKLIYSTEAMTATVGKANNKTKMTPTPSVSPGATTPNPSTTTSPSANP